MAQPVNVEANSKDAQILSTADKEAIVISGLQIDALGAPLFSFQGKANQSLEFHADKAKPTLDALSLLQDFAKVDNKPPPPEGFVKVDYLIADDTTDSATEAVAGGKPQTSAPGNGVKEGCTASLMIRLINGKVPKEIRLFQPDTGTENFQSIELVSRGADVVCELILTQPIEPSAIGPFGRGCGKNIRLADWDVSVQAEFAQTKFIVAADSASTLKFHTIDRTVEKALTDSEGKFEPLKVAESLKAQAIRVIPKNDDASLPAVREIRISDAKRPLTIESIQSRSNEFRVSLSGEKVFLESNGESVNSISVYDWIISAPIIGVFLGAVHGAILAWVGRSLFGKGSSGGK